MLSNIRIVLVETTHPGNIGAVARAMHNMSLDQLYLVAPKHFPSAEATARAAGADTILAQATVCQHLPEAIADCHQVIGTTARARTIAWPELTPRQLGENLINSPDTLKTAVVFGRESSGLSNEELNHCQYTLRIPCNPAFSSLNIAAAVQVIAYELFQTHQRYTHDAVSAQTSSTPEVPLASSKELELFYAHLQETLTDIRFLHPEQARSMMQRLRRLFHKSRLEQREVDILRGILSAASGKQRRPQS